MTAEEVGQKIAGLDAEIKDLESQAVAHEAAAKDARTRRTEARKSREALTVALQSIRVKEIIVTDQAAAAKARADAEQHAADLAKLKEETAAELAKLKAANESAEAKAAEPQKG